MVVACALQYAKAAPVLMISIDGMKPEYVTHADEHGLKIPTLRRFLREGVHAEGVMPVVPSVTYPDHTTLITGVWPSVHGIYNNMLFDPKMQYNGAWYWYADSIKVPTLWDVAHNAHLHTASIGWPVSMNARSVDTLIPEFWRQDSFAPESGNPQDAYMMDAISRPEGMLAERQKRLGAYMLGNDTTVEGDRTKTRYAVDVIEREHPGLLTLHLSSLDEYEHINGPFSAEANATLEALDGMVSELVDAALKADPKTAIVIVSDHGFAHIDHAFNVAIPFIEAGLVEVAPAAHGGGVKVKSWKAEPWATGGMAAIMLHDDKDEATREKVRALLAKLAADPNNGITEIIEGDAAKRSGGFPDAAFLLVLKPGYITGGAYSGPLVSDQVAGKGTHGYMNSFAEMHASFFVMGQGIAKGRNVGQIDMRRVAPTVASLLGVSLPTASEPKLDVLQ